MACSPSLLRWWPYKLAFVVFVVLPFLPAITIGALFTGQVNRIVVWWDYQAKVTPKAKISFEIMLDYGPLCVVRRMIFWVDDARLDRMPVSPYVAARPPRSPPSLRAQVRRC
jgi:hypothetical protein